MKGGFQGRGGSKTFPEGEDWVVERSTTLNHLSPEGWWDDGKRPGASVLPSKFSGGGFWGGNTVGWWDFFHPFGSQEVPRRPKRSSGWCQDTSQTVQDGPKTAHGAAKTLKMAPRRFSDGPRRTPNRRKSKKIDVKNHPHLGFIFCSIFDRFSIDFFDPINMIFY